MFIDVYFTFKIKLLNEKWKKKYGDTWNKAFLFEVNKSF